MRRTVVLLKRRVDVVFTYRLSDYHIVFKSPVA